MVEAVVDTKNDVIVSAAPTDVAGQSAGLQPGSYAVTSDTESVVASGTVVEDTTALRYEAKCVVQGAGEAILTVAGADVDGNALESVQVHVVVTTAPPGAAVALNVTVSVIPKG